MRPCDIVWCAEYKYVTFNAGPRLCLGRGLALMEAKLLLSMIFQQFTLELVPNQEITYLVTVTLMCKNGIRMVPRVRKDRPTTSAAPVPAAAAAL